MLKLGSLKVPKYITFPYKLGKRQFADRDSLENYINFAYAAGKFMPQWDKRKLVPQDEWKNEDGQTLHDIAITRKLSKPKAKAKTSTAKSNAKDKLIAGLVAELNKQGFGKLYQDAAVKFVDKQGVVIRTSAADYVVKVVAKKDPVARVAVGLKDTKANAFKNRVLRAIADFYNDGMLVKGGVVTNAQGKDYLVSITKKSSRVY